MAHVQRYVLSAVATSTYAVYCLQAKQLLWPDAFLGVHRNGHDIANQSCNPNVSQIENCEYYARQYPVQESYCGCAVYGMKNLNHLNINQVEGFHAYLKAIVLVKQTCLYARFLVASRTC